VIEVGTPDGRIVRTIILEEPEDSVLGLVECLRCGLKAVIHKGPAADIASEVLKFSMGHACIQSD
jgi:hypothetical protein